MTINGQRLRGLSRLRALREQRGIASHMHQSTVITQLLSLHVAELHVHARSRWTLCEHLRMLSVRRAY